MLSVKDFVDAFHATGVKPMRESFKNDSCSAVCAVTVLYLKEHGVDNTRKISVDGSNNEIKSWFMKEYGCSTEFAHGVMAGFDGIDGCICHKDYNNGYKLGKEVADIVFQPKG